VTASEPGHEPDRVRVVLRPLGSPVPLGFLVFGTGMAALGGLELHLLPVAATHQAAVLLLTFVAPLELIAAVLAFLARDGLSGSGLGIFAGSWATVGVQYLLAEPGSRSPVQGLYLLTFGVAVLLLAVVARTGNLLLAGILATSAVRTLVAGAYEVAGVRGLQTAAGVLSLCLTVLAFYGALALLWEDTAHATVLPLGRRGAARAALERPQPDQFEQVEQEAGVRRSL
jgi:succinate-acetate transporter protein